MTGPDGVETRRAESDGGFGLGGLQAGTRSPLCRLPYRWTRDASTGTASETFCPEESSALAKRFAETDAASSSLAPHLLKALKDFEFVSDDGGGKKTDLWGSVFLLALTRPRFN